MNSREVKISDYQKEQHKLKVVLNLVGINVDYITTDLIYRTLKAYETLQGKFSVDDGVEIKHEHKTYWENYFQNIKESSVSIKNKDDEWISSGQVRKMLQISAGTLSTLRKNGIVPYTIIGGTLRYKKTDIEKVLQENKKK